MLKSFFKAATVLAVLVAATHATSEVSEAIDYASVCGLVTSDNSIVDFAFEGGSTTVADGEIVTATVSLNENYHDTPPLTVGINAPGIKCGRNKFAFDRNDPSSFEQQVTCRTDSGSVASNKDGSTVDIAMIFNYDFESADAAVLKIIQKICRKLLLKRKVGGCGRGGGVGDPHLTTLDRVNYDFQKPGVFRLFESRNMLVQVFQEKCAPTASRGAASPSCYRGLAVAYAGSVAKLFIQHRKIQLGKGTSSLSWLSVQKNKGNTDGYRIFIASDQSTYIDVNLARWGNDYEYLNIAVQVSPYFKDRSVRGLLGNWNGNVADDLRDNDKLEALHSFPLNDNLFTCVGSGCIKFLSPATIKDEMARSLPNDLALLHQSYSGVDSASITLRSFSPVLMPVRPRLRGLQETGGDPKPGQVRSFVESNATSRPPSEASSQPPTDVSSEKPTDAPSDAPTEAPSTTTPTPEPTQVDVLARAHELCTQVMDQIPVCKKYVINDAFYVDTVCIGDAVLLGDLQVVDNTKLAYLRECRRELDSRIESNSSSIVEMKSMQEHRASLLFGELSCPLQCSGRGSCLAAGCQCNEGFTGMGCEIAIVA